MANNTEEWWSVDGVSLHQYGWSVTTVGGSRYDVPPRRGSNMTLAGRPGQVHRRKLPDARTITLMMFVVGWDPGMGLVPGVAPTTEDQREQWNDNWDFLRRLVYEDYLSDNRVTLTRRWRLTAPTFPTTRTGLNVIAGDPGTPTSGQSRVLVANSYAEMTGTMPPTMTGRSRAEFQLDFTLADPYFYGPKVTKQFANQELAYLWNDAHDVAAHAGINIDFVGPLTNPFLSNISTQPDHYVKYNGTIPAGKIVTVHPGRYQAIEHDPDVSTGINRIARISNSGAERWFNLLPGANAVKLYGVGSGHAVLSWQPPYV